VPRPPRHAFTSAVRAALPRPIGRAAEGYLRLLDRRFAAVAQIAAGSTVRGTGAGMAREDRTRARKFMAPREGVWHDGDENLVRGYLDRWERSAGRASAVLRSRALLEGASALVAMGAPPGALWFFLWEMESVLAGILEADKQNGPC
jgi:hypothetical protein